jgi:hypothetical protein
MTDQEFKEMKSDLQEVKEILAIIAKTVATDTEVAAVRTERRIADEKRQADVLSVINKNRQLLELAD